MAMAKCLGSEIRDMVWSGTWHREMCKSSGLKPRLTTWIEREKSERELKEKREKREII